MKSILLVLALLATTSQQPLKQGPAIEAFLIDPADALKVTDTVKGDWRDTDVVLAQTRVDSLRTFTQRNVGKYVVFSLLRRNPNGTFEPIDLGARTFVRAPITNGVVHIHAINPHNCGDGHHGILLAE